MGKGKKTKTVHPMQKSIKNKRHNSLNKSDMKKLEKEYLKKALVLFAASEYSRKDTSTQELMDKARAEIIELAEYFNGFVNDIENHKYEVRHIEKVLLDDLGLTVGTW